MQAVILAGGLGTRLRPLTYSRPKALLPLVNRPVVLHIIDVLPPLVDEVIIAANYLVGTLEEYFSSNPLKVKVSVVEEGEPMGTGGALKNLEGLVEGTFFALNGDVISSLDMQKLLDFHLKRGGIGTIALWEVEDPEGFGVVGLGDGGRIERFVEKPSGKEAFSRTINAGIYSLQEDILDLIEGGREVSLEREVFPKAIEEGLFGMAFTGFWADVGTLENYLMAVRALLERWGSTISPDCVVSPEAVILDPISIGPKTIMRSGIIGPFVSLGRGCDVASAKVANSTLLDGVKLGEGTIVEDSLIGSGVTVSRDSQLEGCIVADDVTVEKGSKLIDTQVEA